MMEQQGDIVTYNGAEYTVVKSYQQTMLQIYDGTTTLKVPLMTVIKQQMILSELPELDLTTIETKFGLLTFKVQTALRLSLIHI